MRILLVEDNADHRELMCRALTKYDRTWQVVGVTSGEEALRHLTGGETYNLVLLDYRLPERDGLEVLEEIRRSEAPLPVVVVTGRGDEQVAVEVMKSGAYDYVVKSEGYLQRLPVVAQRAMEAHQLAVDRKRVEEALRESEEKYRLLFENAVEGIFQRAPDGRFLAANPAMASILGYTSPEELITSYMDIRRPSYVLPEKKVEFKRLIEERDQIRNFENQVYRKDGSKVWLSEDVRVLKDRNGKILYYEGIVQDITDRKRAEELLRAQRDLALAIGKAGSFEEGMRVCLETAIRISEMDCGGIYFFDESSGALDLILHQGLSAEFVASASHYEKDAPNSQLVMAGRAIYSEHLQLGVPLDKAERREDLGAIAVIPILHEDRIISCMNIASHTRAEVPAFARGALEAIAAQIGNAIIHLRTEEALRRSEARYKELWERAPVAYHVLDPDGKIAKVNQTEASLLGYQVHEMVGKSIFDFILPEQRKEAQKRFRQKIRGLSVPKAEDRIYLRKDGSQIYVVVDDVLERDAHGKVTGIRSTMTDITERKNAEETLARYISELRQLSKQLITVQEAERLRISRELHDEMGQALTMLRINIASIKESLLPGYAKGVKDRLADADALTEKLLGQIHELTLELRPHMLDDLGLVPTVRWYTERLSRRLNIEILFTQKNWKERPDSEISTALFRIIQEALTNAAKHARAKKIRILLAQKQKFIEVLIKDDGRGFDQRKIEKRPPRARGIGLFSMKERAALLNGECTIESHPGKGTRIYVSIPRRKAVEKN
jgi:PAS domain S-box-containing protein